MTSELTPKPFDVWRFPFVFEDQPDVAKERPVVIGAVDETKALLLIVKVTGHGPRPGHPGEVVIQDWQEAGLDKPSTARCSKTLIVPLSAFDDARRYGHLSREDATAIANELRKLNQVI